MASPQTATQPPHPPPARRDWLRLAGPILILGTVLTVAYGLYVLSTVNRAAFGGALVGVGPALLFGAWPILQFLIGKKDSGPPGGRS